MDTAHWPQIMKPMEEIVVQNTTNSCSKPSSDYSSSLERKTRPQKESAVNCPRCNSSNTKFCYYNNYSLSQPRYFCKTCRRYWTEGGSLRNVPVGGGSRKNKRSFSSISSHSSMSKKLPDLVVPHASTQVLSQNPRMMHHEYVHDLNLGFPSTNDFKTFSELIQVPNFDGNNNNNNNNTSGAAATATATATTTTSGSPTSATSAMELLTGITTRGMMNSFTPNYANFSLDGMERNGTYGSNIHEGSSGKLLFPFEDLKTSTISTTTTPSHVEQNRDQNGVDANGFWSGMLGGGSW